MAVRVIDEFGDRANAPDAAYPDGSLKNETTPGVSNDGSPLSSRVGNDFQGFMQSALAEAGIDANGNPDSVDNPQILNSIKSITDDRFNYDGLVYQGIGNISDFAGQQLQESDKTNCYQFPDGSRLFYAANKNATYPVTIPADPSASGDWALVTSASQSWVADNFSGGSNLLSNHNFLIPSPDDSQPAPDATPRSYPAGFEVFAGVFANETTGVSNLTYIDGRVSFSGGDLNFEVPNTGGLERVTDFVASVADFDGKPRTRGVSFSLVGDSYRVTVGIDALTDTDGNDTLLGSVKFQEGKVPDRHDTQAISARNLGDYTDLVYASVSDMVNSPLNKVGGGSFKCSSYSGGWAATNEGPKGGGSFVFDSGSSLNDGVVNFLASDSTGSFRRIDSSNVNFSWAGGRVDNTDAENDSAVSRIVAYCSSNKKGFDIEGLHEVSEGFTTTDIAYIRGKNRDNDGFKMNASAGKTLIAWERPTKLEDLKVEGSIADKLIDDSSVGISRCPYLNRAERLRVQNFGTGIHWHSSVDCHIKQPWVSGCHIGVKLDGYKPEIATAFSTTGSISDGEIHGNYDGVVVGSFNAFNTAFIGFNFHNTVFENNSHIAIVCTNQEAQGVTYSSMQLRNLVFTGYTWFEDNPYMYDLTICAGVMWNSQLRNEGNKPFKDNPDPERSSRLMSSGLLVGREDPSDPYNCKYGYNGIKHVNGGYYASNQEILGFKSFTDSSILAGGMTLNQKLDWSSTGRLTELNWYVKAENESAATEKMKLSRQGNLTISGSYSPFTGVHFFHSETFINSGMAVKGDSFDKVYIDSFTMEGKCTLTDKDEDSGCLGIVDYCEKLSDGYLIAIAAVGDNSTLSMEGAVVDGDFNIGDYLCTSSEPGRLRVYNGDSMKPVILQVKGNRNNLAYGYFK